MPATRLRPARKTGSTLKKRSAKRSVSPSQFMWGQAVTGNFNLGFQVQNRNGNTYTFRGKLPTSGNYERGWALTSYVRLPQATKNNWAAAGATHGTTAFGWYWHQWHAQHIVWPHQPTM